MTLYEVMPLLPTAIAMRISTSTTVLVQPAKHRLFDSCDRGMPQAFHVSDLPRDCQVAAKFAAVLPKGKFCFPQTS